ncbi:protein phosphatase 2C domain-containing protein, partial [Patescibacteria group bacterium]|nr:protein phosphatase 2C domain-containing protein [Patescibacteria group bacterium]
GHLQPPEDAYKYLSSDAVVADGVTREPLPIRDRRKLTFEQATKGYPNPSGARLAADLFCETFVRRISRQPASKEKIKTAFRAGNEAIHKLNLERVPRPDYMVNDYFSCVAAGWSVSNSKLSWGVIGDCGLIIYSRTGQRRFETRDQVLPVTRHLNRIGMDLALPKNRKFFRQILRNNPDYFFNGRHVSYGALTGERTAEHYLECGEFDLSPGDLIVCFSDGFWQTVRHAEFFQRVYRDSASEAEQSFIPFALGLARRDQAKYGREGTLVAFKFTKE